MKESISKTINPFIIIASNRGPFSFKYKKGILKTTRGAGGLVTALSALAERQNVLWVASALAKGDIDWAEANPGVQQVEDMLIQLILPDKKSYDQYYNVISNPLLWFIHHQLWDAPRKPCITQATWEAWENGYIRINRLFANSIIESINTLPDAQDRPIIVFPQDYHLYLVPRFLRDALGDRVQIQPFIHIPWPGTDAWQILPAQMRNTLLDGLLASDRIGFQTKTAAFNFVQTCRFFLNNAHSYGSRNSIDYDGRKVGAIDYPISIDVEKVEALTQEQQTQLHKHQLANIVGDRKLILRTDRIEPSKNILRGLEAYRSLLERHPEHQGKVIMLALLVPSRMEVDEYQTYFQEIMGLAGMINAEFSDGLWEPVRVIVGNNYARAIAAMQLYDVLLVNPLADGMNLVAKEGVLVNHKAGVLVLSEQAGAFNELGEYALPVSPFDVYGTAETLHHALNMPHEEREKRGEALREIVKQADITKWFQLQVDDAIRALSSQAKSLSMSPTP